jgi:predicted dehydrogenase
MKNYVIMGAGNRAYDMFAYNLTNDFKDCVKITAICDPNQTRCRYFKTKLLPDLNIYDSFDQMLDVEKPDAVIVATVDCTHHEYIIRALDKGYDVITEKPMTTDAEKCLAIFEAEKRSGRKVIVTFNFRFMPYAAKIKEILMQGQIGNIRSINFEYLLGREHGADYMRRWHAEMKNSGGMLIHKSTHHFDVVNWLIDDEPVSVSAMGSLDFYGPTREKRGVCCQDCEHKKTCEFYFDVTEGEFMNEMYAKAKQEDGYLRDGCVFSDRIDIYDNMSVSVRYSKGSLLTYSLNLYNPYEGYKLTITGDKGRLEGRVAFHSMDSGEKIQTIDVIFDVGNKTTYSFTKNGGMHGGGDKRLLEMIFRGGVEDKLNQFSNSYDGAKSLLIGFYANESIRTGKRIEIKPMLDKIKNIRLNTLG